MPETPLPQTALITGGSSGIGLALACQLAAQGAHVWLAARDTNRLQAALETVRTARRLDTQRFGFSAVDVSDPEQARRAVAEAEDSLGPLHLVINSAGICLPGYFHQQDLALMRQTIDINFFGTLYVARSAAERMIPRRSGHIINISSEAGFLGLFGYTAYCGSKFALAGFSDALRCELKPHGVRLSIVYPPDVDTPQLAYETQLQPPETRILAPLRSVMSAEAVAREILSGARRGHYVILPGFDSKMMYALTRLLGTGIYPLMDFLMAILPKRRS